MTYIIFLLPEDCFFLLFIFCREVLPVMNSLRFCFSEEVFVYLSLLMHNFTGYKFWVGRVLFFFFTFFLSKFKDFTQLPYCMHYFWLDPCYYSYSCSCIGNITTPLASSRFLLCLWFIAVCIQFTCVCVCVFYICPEYLVVSDLPGLVVWCHWF